MRYIKTLNIWAEGVEEAITTGAIKLQRGQWLRCGTNKKPCRFVEVMNSGVLNVVHWKGTPAKTSHCFNVSIKAKKTRDAKRANRQETYK